MLTAMILAAGRGERMRPLTDTMPKPLLAVGGKPLIIHLIERLRRAGFERVVINHAHLGAQLLDALGDGERFGLDIRYSAEPVALETAGGVAHARSLIGEAPFLMVSGDIYCDYDFSRLLPRLDEMAANRDAPLAHLVMVDNPAFHPQGDFALVDGFLETGSPHTLTFGNISCFQPRFFDPVPAGAKLKLLNLLLPQIDAHRVSGEHFQGLWRNVGTPEDLRDTDRLAAAQIFSASR